MKLTTITLIIVLATDISANAQERSNGQFNYDPEKPLLIDGNGGDDSKFLFRSLLTRWNGDIVFGNDDFVSPSHDFDEGIVRGRVQVVASLIGNLYMLAYGDTVPFNLIKGPNSYGKWRGNPILEVADSSEFEYDANRSRNHYNYSLIVPSRKATAKFLQQVMQADLQSYFGYQVSVETRNLPYWKMTVDPKMLPELLKSPAVKPDSSVWERRAGFYFRDKPVYWVRKTLQLYFQDEPPFCDETGVTKNINFFVEVLVTDINAVKDALASKGIILTRSHKPMKVVVIREKAGLK